MDRREARTDSRDARPDPRDATGDKSDARTDSREATADKREARMDVRDATAEDAAAVAGLLDELGYPSTPAEVGRRLEIRRSDAYSRVLLAIDDGRIVGSMSIHAFPHLEHDGRTLRIESLVVTAGTRGTGAGRLLIEAAETLARSWDCGAIEVTSSRRREGAHAFYRRLGFTDVCDRSARFWKDL
jgi:GNAT superfamily N-acetyltransferase